MKAGLVLGVVALANAGSLPAQQQQPQTGTPLAVGVEAPDFTLSSATRSGVGKPVSLHDYRGQVVVLAFFYRARTAG
jgi:cytochrome oxidase Cu insertion factor (SCO1/SenC/PrrC family)